MKEHRFALRSSAWLTRIEYALLLIVIALLWMIHDRLFAALLTLLILLLGLRWRVQGQLLLPHRLNGQLELRDNPPRLICYACGLDEGPVEWPLARLRVHATRHGLLLRHGRWALLLVADSFDSPAEHARFRRRLFQLMENHAS
jgi:hypothetical protein